MTDKEITKEQYLERITQAWETGKISDEAYDAAIMNINEFTEE